MGLLAPSLQFSLDVVIERILGVDKTLQKVGIGHWNHVRVNQESLARFVTQNFRARDMSKNAD